MPHAILLAIVANDWPRSCCKLSQPLRTCLESSDDPLLGLDYLDSTAVLR